VSVVLDNVRSLYNVGSVFRTCDSALVRELILCGFTPHPPRPEIEKTALGAVDSVPWRYCADTINAIKEQKQKGEKIIAVEITENQRPYDSLGAGEFPVCLVFGNELTGLSDSVIAECDDALEIPMYGVKHSLNVSVAVGVATFEAVRAFRSQYY
jgi:tRNA G18 (ribose-2'-O)-methylase SpoU